MLIEWKAIIYTTIGGIVGIIFGLEYCQLTPPYAKMLVHFFSFLFPLIRTISSKITHMDGGV